MGGGAGRATATGAPREPLVQCDTAEAVDSLIQRSRGWRIQRSWLGYGQKVWLRFPRLGHHQNPGTPVVKPHPYSGILDIIYGPDIV